MAYSCDFETITTAPTRVWLWAICDINNIEKVTIGNDIDSFFNEINRDKYNKTKLYFHNLKFDGMFITYHLLKNMDFKHIEDGKLTPGTFTTLISGMGQWYQIKIRFEKVTVTIQDSLKKLPFSVKTISKAFDLPIAKGEIDYQAKREVGYKPTKEEIEYIKLDVQIVAQALKIQFDQGLKEMTVGADALKSYKDMTGKFRTMFPLLNESVDAFCRKAYKGGYVYCNPLTQGKDITERGSVYDVNSMYPCRI